MKNIFRKTTSCILAAALLGTIPVFASAAETVDYKITDPYAGVEHLLGDDANHYKTNLHTHSTASDANEDLNTMIKGYYNEDFDVLGMSDHGVIGKEWNKRPSLIPLYLYQYIIGNKVTPLTDEEYAGITDGTYPVAAGYQRTGDRGMLCVPTGIELNMLTITKSHVNSYFSDFGEGDIGFENGFEYAVKNAEKAGGISIINHPGDWLGSNSDYSIATKEENVRLFGDIFNKYKTCQGMEIFNDRDIAHGDRILWDSVLRYVIPHGERNVWAYANSDAHTVDRIDSSFMDFIMPECTVESVKETMMNGCFFSIGRYARAELGHDFRGTGAYPVVTSIEVDDENDIIRVRGKNADKIQWIADGNIIVESTGKNDKGEIVSVIRLREHTDEISCYVRFQLVGKGGLCCSQAFICDAGNFSELIIEDTRTEAQKTADKVIYNLKSLRIFVIFKKLFDAIFK